MVFDLIFSLYPDPSDLNRELNYSIQIVDRENYYPNDIENIINIIRKSTSTLERENAIDAFYNQISIKKKNISDLIDKIDAREHINLRPIYILVNDDHILTNTKDDIIFVGGPLIGGNFVLDHELERLIPEKEFSLICFDEKDVCQSINCVEIKNYNNSVKLCDVINEHCDLTIDKLPIEINNKKYCLFRAKYYYSNEYEKINTMNDFSPILDSSFVAASVLLQANLKNFNPFPNILLEKLDQNLIFNDLPDYLCIQKYVQATEQTVELMGYTFIHEGKRYAIGSGVLFDGLKYLLISETSLDKLISFVNGMKADREFKNSIREYEANTKRLGNQNINKFEGRLSESIRNRVGRKSLHSSLNNADDYLHKIPLGIFKYIYGTHGHRFLMTSFDNDELPIEYLSSLDIFNDITQLLISGSLKIFNYKVDLFNIHLKIGKLRFALSIKPNYEIKELFEGMITIELRSIDELRLLYSRRNREIPEWIDDFIDAFDLTKLFYEYDHVAAKMGQLLAPCIRTIDLSEQEIINISEEKLPLTSLSRRLLKNSITPVLLKRILSEIEIYETGSGVPRKELKENNTASKNKVTETYKSINNDSNSQRISIEINNYNRGLFEFLNNTVRRGELLSEIDDINIVISRLFEDIKVALVDFGLIPNQWVNASNLQIMETYRSQKNWLRHSFETILRELIGLDMSMEELPLLLEYRYSINQIYNTFNGNYQGSTYIALKKAFLYFNPKIKRFKKELFDVKSISELINRIELLENKNRMAIRVNLPKLPKFAKL